MKKFLVLSLCLVSCVAYAQDTLFTDSVMREFSVVSFTRNTVNTGSLITIEELQRENYGQEPSHIFNKMPSIFSFNDNGTDFGYGYFRIRGLDQTRVNVSIDGCPWNEAEDYGLYFANSPDLMSSMHSIKVERGASTLNNGIAGSAGGVNLESIDLYKDTASYIYLGGGSYKTGKVTAAYNMGDRNGWGLHLRGTTQFTDGFRNNSFNRSLSFSCKTGYRFNLNHKIDILSITGFHENNQGYIGNTIEELDVTPRANGCTPNETDNWVMSMNRLQYVGRLSDSFILTSSAYLQYQNGSYRIDYNHWGEDKLMDLGLEHYMYGGNIFGKYYFHDFNLSVGTNIYGYNRRHFLADNSTRYTTGDLYNNTGYKTDITLFANVNYTLLKKVLLSANIQQRNVYFSYKDNLDDTKSFGYSKYNTNWQFVNFGFGTEYTPASFAKIYARFNYVWREPTRTQMFSGYEYAFFDNKGELATTTPELCKDLEVGTEWNYGRVRGNVNFFSMWFDDELVLTGRLGANGLPEHTNVKKSLRIGGEFVVNYNFWKGMHFDNAFSLSKNTIDTDEYGSKTHVMSPSYTFNSDIYWKDTHFYGGLNYNYRSSMYIDLENNHTVPDMWTFNLYFQYSIKHWNFGLRINNITNRKNYCNGTLSDLGERLLIRNANTNFNINVKYIF